MGGERVTGIETIHQILGECTRQYRTGDSVTHDDSGVTEIGIVPHVDDAPSTVKLVDCEFVIVGVDLVSAKANAPRLRDALSQLPDLDRFRQGLSYIELGAMLGDQGAALCLMAVGEALEWWNVITPKSIGVTDPVESRNLAGMGLVMFSGYEASVV